jgi:AcrR family transcriptional regulator
VASESIDPGSRRTKRGTGRDALRLALIRVVAREGLDGVTFRSVAAEAGVTHGLATNHFGTREAMIRDALSWAARHALERARIGSDAASLDEFAADVPAFIGDRPEEAVFQFELLLESLRRPVLAAHVRRTYDRYTKAVQDSLGRFGLPEDEVLAKLVFAAIDGLTLQQLLYGDAAVSTAALQLLRRLPGLAAGQARAQRRRPAP